MTSLTSLTSLISVASVPEKMSTVGIHITVTVLRKWYNVSLSKLGCRQVQHPSTTVYIQKFPWPSLKHPCKYPCTCTPTQTMHTILVHTHAQTCRHLCTPHAPVHTPAGHQSTQTAPCQGGIHENYSLRNVLYPLPPPSHLLRDANRWASLRAPWSFLSVNSARMAAVLGALNSSSVSLAA